MHRGGVISHPKTWLSNTLMHKFNSGLRKKYRAPVTVNLDTLALPSPFSEPESLFLESEEAESVRKELIRLAKTTREVLVRFYFAENSVSDIAKQLGIPEGTVKSRLAMGRKQMKKGLTKMDTYKNHIPGRLHLSHSGSAGLENQPMSLVENDLIAQNLLALCYEKPLSITELSLAISIPAPYLEPLVQKLTEGELLARTGANKYFADFIIYNPEDALSHFPAQLAFVHKHFSVFWQAMEGILQNIHALDWANALSERQLKKLERYAVMQALQRFQLSSA